MNTSTNTTLPFVPARFAIPSLLAVLVPLAAGCGARSAAHSTPAPAEDHGTVEHATQETPTSEPRASEPKREPVESEAPAASSTRPASPWSAEVLDTGVDLSKVKLAKKTTENTVTVTNASPAAHDHDRGNGETPQRPGTYSGGPPDPDEHTDGDSGFISIAESSAIHDFGSLTQGDKVTHAFELETSGPRGRRRQRDQDELRLHRRSHAGADGRGLGRTLRAWGSRCAPGSRSCIVEAAAGHDDETRSRVRSVVTVQSTDPRGSRCSSSSWRT